MYIYIYIYIYTKMNEVSLYFIKKISKLYLSYHFIYCYCYCYLIQWSPFISSRNVYAFFTYNHMAIIPLRSRSHVKA